MNSALARLLSALSLVLACTLVACLTPPTPRDLVSTGFRTPEQAFRTWRTAIASGDLVDLEYDCISIRMKERTQMSELIYREARDELLRREPFLRMAISTTEVMDVQMIGDTHAIITSSALGNEFQIVMLREDFWEAWAGDEILYDGSIPAGQFEAWLQKSDDERWATGVAPLKKPEDYEKITEIRVGQDWHIDEIPGIE
jgi:hypothetical protein